MSAGGGLGAEEAVGPVGRESRAGRCLERKARSRWRLAGMERAEGAQTVAGISCGTKEFGLAPRAPHLAC